MPLNKIADHLQNKISGITISRMLKNYETLKYENEYQINENPIP